MTDLEAYQVYCSVKNHFQRDSYDYTKYGLNRKRFSARSFQGRSDRYYFGKLAKKYQNIESTATFLASNFVFDPDTWIGDLVDGDTHHTRYRIAKSNMEAIHYTTVNDFKKVIDATGSVKKAFVDGTDIPPIIKMMLNEEISPESVIMLNKTLDFAKVIDHNIGQLNPIWSRIQTRIHKYTPFVVVKDVTTLRCIRSDLRNIMCNFQG